MSEKNVSNMVSWVLHASFAVLFAAGGFIINLTFVGIEKNSDKIDLVPEKYVSKTDYREDQARLLNAISDLGDKIDHNSEYMEADYNRRMDKLEDILTKKSGN